MIKAEMIECPRWFDNQPAKSTIDQYLPTSRKSQNASPKIFCWKQQNFTLYCYLRKRPLNSAVSEILRYIVRQTNKHFVTYIRMNWVINANFFLLECTNVIILYAFAGVIIMISECHFYFNFIKKKYAREK